MIRRTGMLICLIIIFTICLASCGEKKNAASEEQKNESVIDKQKQEAATEQPKQTSGNVGVIKCGDGLAFDISFDEFLKTWNGLCSDDIRVPGKDDWESYTTDRAIHYKSPANNYLYAPGDNDALFPMLHIYTSEKDDKVVQIELSYDDHSMQEYTYNLYEKMCVISLKCILQAGDTYDLSKICSEVNTAGSENVVQHDQEYGEDAIPPLLFYTNGAGVYLYYEIGSRMHFCIIPVDQQNLSEFQKAGAKIEKIHL